MPSLYEIALEAVGLAGNPKIDRLYPNYSELTKVFEAQVDAVIHGPITSREHIFPVIPKGGKLFHIKPVDLHKTAFTWDPKLREEADGLRVLTTIRTLHGYGYHGFFKPSIAEVLVQIPDDLIADVVAFSTDGPNSADDFNDDLLALDAGYHVATTTLYGRAT
jgi:hypothetical protein